MRCSRFLAGWLGDRIGPRRVLMRIVVWWSFFTAATGWIWNLPSLLVTRSFFGVGEAGCFPNLTRVFTTWLPVRERERAQAILWLSSRWGAALTPLLVAYLLRFISWRRLFELFGLIGILWAIAFYTWYRDDPSTHRGVNRSELAMLPPSRETAVVHGPIPWRTLLSSPTIWLICAQYVCLAYGWWFYITWLPTYLSEARGTGAMEGALLAGMPLLLGGLGCIVSAALTPVLARRTSSVSVARRILAVTGFAWRVDFQLRVHEHPGSDDGHARPEHGELFQRLRDASRLGRLHGHRRAVFRHRLGRHEHDGRHCRRMFAAGRRLPARLDFPRAGSSPSTFRRPST